MMKSAFKTTGPPQKSHDREKTKIDDCVTDSIDQHVRNRRAPQSNLADD
jgi:hypothetical protein